MSGEEIAQKMQFRVFALSISSGSGGGSGQLRANLAYIVLEGVRASNGIDVAQLDSLDSVDGIFPAPPESRNH